MTLQEAAAAGRRKPRITLSVEDFEQLSVLARAAMSRLPDIASELTDELERAELVPAADYLGGVVCMGSEVTFRDESTGKTQRVTLVYPDKADIAQSRVSVLTPIGTALIGLRIGASIEWETRTGEVRELTVLDVAPPPRP